MTDTTQTTAEEIALAMSVDQRRALLWLPDDGSYRHLPVWSDHAMGFWMRVRLGEKGLVEMDPRGCMTHSVRATALGLRVRSAVIHLGVSLT